MRRALFFLLLLVTKASIYAQEEFIEPARFLSRIPFVQLTGGVILLQGQLGNHADTLNFILDSGSGGISLDSSTVQYFGIKTTKTNKTIRGIAGTRKVDFVYNQRLRLQNFLIDSLDFHINDYSILTSVYGLQVDGIIGYSVLSRYNVKINYDSLYIEFWSKGTMKYPKGGFFIRPQITTLPVTGLQIRDERRVNSRFLYDMGAGLNLMLTTDFIKDSSFLKKKRRLFPKSGEGLGGKIDMNMTVMKEVKVGPYKFRNVPIYVFDDDYNVTSYPYLAGLIGNDLLRRFNCMLDYEHRSFYLIPNTHFWDVFDYSYSGMEFYFVNGRIVVGDISKGSPADKAGLKEGDVVLAVNKNFSQNLSVYKAELQTAGEKVKIVVRRDTQLLEFQFKIISIF